MIVGFSGFEMSEQPNTRLRVDCKIEETLNCDMTTCNMNIYLFIGADSRTVEMDFNLIIYKA